MFRAMFVAFALQALLASPEAQAQQTPQLSAESFTRDPAIWSASISPDGNYVAAIQRSSLGDVITIIDWRTRVARPTQLARRENSLRLDWVAWKSDDRVVFSLRQEPVRNRTPGTTRVYSALRDGTSPVLMHRLDDTYAPIGLLDILADEPAHILLATYAQHGYTVYRTNVTSGRVDEIVDYADWDTVEMLVDGRGYPVMRVDLLFDNSGWKIYRRAPGRRDWTLAHEVRRATIAQNRDFFPLGAGPGPGQVYVAARPEGRGFQSIFLYNTASGALGEPVFAHERSDASVAWLDPNDHSVVVGCGETQRWECRAIRPGIQRHLDGLNTFFSGDADIGLIGVSRDERYWLVAATGPTMPLSYFVYDSTLADVSFVASTQPLLPQAALTPTRIVEYTSRDGVSLWGYLTMPTDAGPHPLVVMPHGGPESRDSYGYDFFVQFLAWRGYAVFQPNFRGSEGSGRTFANAGRGQWGRRMQDDITDGVQHLVATGAADRSRICIVGASYGGYAALAGATLTPDLYSCAVSIAGVADLLDLLAVERRNAGRGSTRYTYTTALIGDPERDREELIAVSPARQANRVNIPILLIHGSEDAIVPYEQSETMREALREAGKQVELIELEGEGHSWSNWSRENRQRLLEETDRFLARHLRN